MENNERTMLTGGDKDQSGPQIKLPPTLRISLGFTSGPLKGKRLRFVKSVVTVGRKAPADIVVPDPTVSGSHARFEIVNQIVTLFDCESMNGTFVSGEKIKEPKTVNNMDEVGFGDTRALLTVVNDPYGLYSEEFESEENASAPSQTAPPTESFERCLLGGYLPQRKNVVENLIRNRRLSKETFPVNNGGEFIEAAAIGFRDGKPIDVVITEIKMPLLNGVQASIAFRNMERAFGITKAAPIVLFTETARDSNIDKAVSYLKPATYLQSVNDPAEFQRRAEALIVRLNDLARKRNG